MGVSSFEDLQTVDGQQYDTFRTAAVAMGLLLTDEEWDQAMSEAVRFKLPAAARRTFTMILTTATNVDFRVLWDKYKDYMVNQHRRKSPAIMEQHVLSHIASILAHQGKKLVDFNLPDYNQAAIDADTKVECQQDAQTAFTTAFSSMNPKQAALTTEILALLDGSKLDDNRWIFCEAAGGTGKSFTFNAILNAAKARGKKVLAIASTGIAAQLLLDGRTAHTAFQLGIDLTPNSTSHIQAQSPEAQALRDLDGLLYDRLSCSPAPCLTSSTIYCVILLHLPTVADRLVVWPF